MSRSELRDELVALILGVKPTLSGTEVAEKGGLSEDDARRLWRALGFPDAGDTIAYGEADVEALKLVAGVIDSGVVDATTVFRMTRALGQTMSKLADWQVSTLVDFVEKTLLANGEDVSRHGRLETAIDLARQAEPYFENLLLYVWRRHLAAAATRIETLGASDQELLSTKTTIGFADLSRFTALSNDLDDESLATLVEQFEIQSADIVGMHGGRVIKTMGDAVLYVNDDPRAATLTAFDLVNKFAARHDMPDLRVGLATGPTIARLGDVFGPAVNLAARLTNVARSSRVLVDEATAKALDPSEFEQRALPPRNLRGFGNVSPITVSRRRSFRAR